MELLGGLLVLAAMAWVGLTICAGGLCADQPHQDMTRPLPKAERPRVRHFAAASMAAASEVGRMGFSCWDEACDVNAINRLLCGNDIY